MSLNDYRDTVRSQLRRRPQLRYLESFITNNYLGNSACQDRRTLAQSVIVLDRIGGVWEERATTLKFWEPLPNADGQAIVLDYLDSNSIERLGQEFSLDPQFFQSHLAGCEQHYSGDWATSDLTAPSCLRSSRQKGNFITVDYRRTYDVSSSVRSESFNHSRKQRCSLLRSFHLTLGSNVLFHHERYSVTWFSGNSRRVTGWISHV